MSINKTLKMSWEGTEYDISITMRLIDKIEEEINLMKMVERATTGDVRFSHAAKLIALLLQSAGCAVTTEEVFQGVFGDTDLPVDKIVGLLWEIFGVIFPEPKKKSEEKPKSLKRTRGKNSTKA